MLVYQCREFGADLTGKHLAHDLDRLGVGDPESATEFAEDAPRRQRRRDLRAAAVHDHGMHAHLLEEHHVFGERALELVIHHGVATELHDDGAPVEAAQPGQSLDERRRLGRGIHVVRIADVFGHQLEYALFSCT